MLSAQWPALDETIENLKSQLNIQKNKCSWFCFVLKAPAYFGQIR